MARGDSDVLDWFRAQGPGYQTRINAVLKAFRFRVPAEKSVRFAWMRAFAGMTEGKLLHLRD
jgi:hypothetical protein